MYEDAWYSFVPELQRGRTSAQGPGHRRRESLLQQPTSAHPPADAVETLGELLEEDPDDGEEDEDLRQARVDGLLRRARSFSDIPTGHTTTRGTMLGPMRATPATKEETGSGEPVWGKQQQQRKGGKRRGPTRKRVVTLEALALAGAGTKTAADLEWRKQHEKPVLSDAYDSELLRASQQEFLTYRDQLGLTERHLGSLLDDANGALQLLSSLADAFRAVEAQTASFQAQCDDLLSEQRRLQKLADEVGTDLHYYAYLDTATRRLNAPGASRLVDDEEFADILSSLDSCIRFMAQHPTYRDAESYLARYQALLTKALHVLEVGFTARLEMVATDLAKQIAGTQSDSAQHALAYGRFGELLVDASYALVPNVQQTVAAVYTPQGAPRPEPSTEFPPPPSAAASSLSPSSPYSNPALYANTARNLFHTYLNWRDQVLRPLVRKELDDFHAETKGGSAAAKGAVETAARRFVKQSFERIYHETRLFHKVFAVDPQYSTHPDAVFSTLRTHRSYDVVNAVNVAPVANALQTALAAASDVAVVAHVLGWVTHEYLLAGYEDDDDDDDDGRGGDDHKSEGGEEAAYFAAHSRQLAARLLAEHLWVFADALFEAEVAKSITKAAATPADMPTPPPNALNGQSAAAASAYAPVRRATELLVLFDQAMPKERCQRNSPVIVKIVKEAIQAVQRAAARMPATRSGTAAAGGDADLFVVKNLLILKNELLALEIGDLRGDNGGFGASAGAGGLQHFGQIWDALSLAQNLVGYFTHFIPGTSSLWGRGGASNGEKASAGTPSTDDVGEQLDDALRRAIQAFTQRWAARIRDSTSRALGGKNVAKIERELDTLLQAAFGHQPEVVAKLKEAIQLQAQPPAAPAAPGGGGASPRNRVRRV
ncbi:golgi complex component [Niveomyces insectorum RCEF 264]|uniref:Conserved oligomeric Golgi complex subunit 3 n=1 Tax=Niveomyces insectorum RCEF 264 TaxID=1081102 RepID=A0A162MNW2_9HYPO|nr:golgi complex component [Niveomyces insectorum RCEF 264]